MISTSLPHPLDVFIREQALNRNNGEVSHIVDPNSSKGAKDGALASWRGSDFKNLRTQRVVHPPRTRSRKTSSQTYATPY